LSKGIAAIFGPGSSDTSAIVSSIAEAVEVPQLAAFWERDTVGVKDEKDPMMLNLFPDTDMLSRAYAELLLDYTWKSYTIVYEDEDSLMRLKDVLENHGPDSTPITVR
jgi:ABC-type branched-subunit amino acid transport system substrate-binding protein